MGPWIARIGWISIGWSIHKFMETEKGKNFKKNIKDLFKKSTEEKEDDE